jgi:hypothetical protein
MDKRDVPTFELPYSEHDPMHRMLFKLYKRGAFSWCFWRCRFVGLPDGAAQ